jgi:Ca2+-binding RTX toxin-like protein
MGDLTDRGRDRRSGHAEQQALVGASVAATATLTLSGTAYADLVVGDSGDNNLVGTAGADTIRAMAGDDVVHALAGDDSVLGGRGADRLWGEGGRDTLNAGRDPRVDRLYGGPADDTLYIFGRDRGWGGGGNDVIYATYSQGAMEIWCGPGNDRVIYNQPSPDVELHGCEHVRVVSAG